MQVAGLEKGASQRSLDPTQRSLDPTQRSLDPTQVAEACTPRNPRQETAFSVQFVPGKRGFVLGFGGYCPMHPLRDARY